MPLNDAFKLERQQAENNMSMFTSKTTVAVL